MKKHLVLALLCAAAPALVAQEGMANRFTGGLSLVSTYGDYRAFTNQTLGYGAEVTYDILKTTDAINVRGMVGVVRVNGKERSDLGTSFRLNGVRAGLDFTFRTPNEKVVPYVGIIVTKWSGHANGQGTLLPEQLDFSDNEGKFGFRVGVDYSINRNLIVAGDYSFSEWRHNLNNAASKKDPRVVNGFNPVNPSWGTVTLRWRL